MQFEDLIISYKDFEPHAMCLLPHPEVIINFILCDFIIWASYMVIGVLLYSLRNLPIVYKTKMAFAFWIFGLFIVFCGCTHLFHIITLFYPIYDWEMYMRGATAAVSLAAAIFVAVNYTRMKHFLTKMGER